MTRYFQRPDFETSQSFQERKEERHKENNETRFTYFTLDNFFYLNILRLHLREWDDFWFQTFII